MALVQDDHVVQTLTTDVPDEALHIGILPWALGGNKDLLAPHVVHPLPEVSLVDTITVAQEVPWGLCRKFF